MITKFCSERIAKYAFEYAYLNNRKTVTAVHKANIMKLADGLFLESCREVAKKYPGIKYNEIIVDNCCMQLVSKPEQFDVMVCGFIVFIIEPCDARAPFGRYSFESLFFISQICSYLSELLFYKNEPHFCFEPSLRVLGVRLSFQIFLRL